MSLAAAAWSRVLDAVFPPRCVGCRTFGTMLCEDCLATAPRADGRRCGQCGRPGSLQSCLACYTHPPRFRETRALFVYTGAARSAVLALKFHGVTAVGPVMAAPMAELLISWSPPIDRIAPVPLAGVRRRTRGYNQSETLASELSKLVGVPVDTKCVRRVRNTTPQTQQRDAVARRTGVRGAFQASAGVDSARILLVDDVVTTGATFDSGAGALREAGAAGVYCLAFARED